MSDWTGNNKSTFSTLGASSHALEEREQHDFYATDPKAIDFLLRDSPLPFLKEVPIWEPCCGHGHLSKRLEEHGFKVKSTDLIDRGYGEAPLDFLKYYGEWDGDIITNPPYKYAKEFVEHSLKTVTDGHTVAMFLKLQFLEGKGRKMMFLKTPPRYLLVSCSRMMCAKNGEFNSAESSAVAYGWFVWLKGDTSRTEIVWGN